MSLGRSEFERIRTVIEAVEAEEPLTAREIQSVLEEHGEDIDSPHRVATILGREAKSGHVRVIEDRPYRYTIAE